MIDSAPEKKPNKINIDRVREQYEVTLSVHMLRGPILDHYVNSESIYR